MKLIRHLLNAGIDGSQDDSSIKEKRTFNTFLFGTIIIVFPLSIISLISGMMINFLLCSGGIIIFLFLYLGARNGYTKLAKNLFIYLCLLSVVFGSIYNYSILRFNGVENLLFPLILISVLLFDTKGNAFQTFLMILSMIGLNIIKRQFEALPFDDEFAIRLTLGIMISLAIFLLTQIYRHNEMLLQKKLTDQKNVLYALIDHVPVMMSLIDTEKRFQIVNKPFADFLNLKREEMIGVKCEKILPDLMTQKHQEWCNNATADKAIKFNDEINLGGKTYYFTGKYVPIKDKNGDVKYVSQHLVDVSELKNIETSLKEANDAKNKLLSMLAHDIRSPLAMLSSTMKMDQSRDLSDEEFIWLKDNINNKLTNLIGSLNTLLDWARHQTEGLKSEKSSFCLYKLLLECVESHQDFAQLKNIELVLESNVTQKVLADSNHLKLVVRNLIHNAIKFSEKSSKVVITADQNGTDVVLTIADSGIGMHPNQVKSILTGAIQQSAYGTSGEKGNGLGLSLSLGLLNLNGHDYSINSEPDKGTQIVIQIPLAEKVVANQYQ